MKDKLFVSTFKIDYFYFKRFVHSHIFMKHNAIKKNETTVITNEY